MRFRAAMFPSLVFLKNARRIRSTFAMLICLLGLCQSAAAFDYQLEPVEVAPDTYVIFGSKEDFTRENGGDIVNVSFIVTSEGVLLIDTGPSFTYGKQLKSAIKTVTEQPVNKILLTHQHPDHIFGLQAFPEAPVYALPETVEAIQSDSENALDHLYRIVGDAMKSTENTNRVRVLTYSKEVLGQHTFRYFNYAGHSQADLVIVDETTGVVFASDLVFANRAPTTPHADLTTWKEALDELDAMHARILVPGHGDLVVAPARAIKQTREYLSWLYLTLSTAVETGSDMNDAMEIEIPDQFQTLRGVKREFERSVVHLFRQYEDDMFLRTREYVDTTTVR